MQEAEDKDYEDLSQSLAMPINKVSAWIYVVGIVPVLGLIWSGVLLYLEKDKRVRFHAYQSIALFGLLDMVVVLFYLTVILSRLNQIIILGGFVVWLLLILRTSEGKVWELPIVGTWARRRV